MYHAVIDSYHCFEGENCSKGRTVQRGELFKGEDCSKGRTVQRGELFKTNSNKMLNFQVC